jgi:AcrR family transcriptional regulator
MSPRRYCSPARAASSGQTRERIVAAAAALLRTPEGIRGFSLEAVGKAAKVTRLTVYNQFGSRRALLEAVFDDRAERGGLRRVSEAMAAADPAIGLLKLIDIFCEFWSSDRDALARLHGGGINDAELEESIRARNERRRRALSVLVDRMAERKAVRAEARRDLIDTLFALTSFHFFAELAAGRRSPDAAGLLVQAMAADAVRRASTRAT